MLAYLFWHRPYPTVETGRYEESLRRFQRHLVEQRPAGLRDVSSYRISAVPWLGDCGGYEDWCYVDGSWALDILNNVAVTGDVKAPHDAAAAQMEVGQGGLYTLVWGTPNPASRHAVVWLTRPRGIEWRSALAPIKTRLPEAVFWRRQMVLGPAPEFAVVIPLDQQFAVPDGWIGLRVSSERL